MSSPLLVQISKHVTQTVSNPDQKQQKLNTKLHKECNPLTVPKKIPCRPQVELVGRIVFKDGGKSTVHVPSGKAVLLVVALAVGVSEARRHRPQRQLGQANVREKAAQQKWKMSYGN